MINPVRTNGSEVDDRALRIVFVGHVDHGKSTLVGRILHETGSVFESKIQYVEAICRDRGTRFEYAFLLDAFEEEQDQGVTIDVSQVVFKTKKRPYRIIDAPGHKEFLKNMISGASSADAAILMIDAQEGLREQTKRHATILSLLGIRSILVAVNKMDLVGYREEAFLQIEKDYRTYLKSLKIEAKLFIPISAYVGDNVVSRTSSMKWYQGPTMLEALDGLDHHQPAAEKPFRLPLQDVYRFDRTRIFAGRVESGSVSVGDEVMFLPSKKNGIIKSIEVWNAAKRNSAGPGESIGITLEDQVFVERGEVAVHSQNQPNSEKQFEANIFWMGEQHLQKGKNYIVKLTTQDVQAQVQNVTRVINSSTLVEVSQKNHEVAKNEVAEAVLKFKSPVVFDTFDDIQTMGRFVIVDEGRVSGGGIILRK